MAALDRGTTAPDFSLPTVDGKQFSLREALTHGPVVAAFFKISCPTCQYAFPFLQRIYEAHGNSRITIVGISQNEKKDTAAFMKQFGVTSPSCLMTPALTRSQTSMDLPTSPQSSGSPRTARSRFPAWVGFEKRWKKSTSAPRTCRIRSQPLFSEISRSPIFVPVEGQKLARGRGQNYFILSPRT